MLRTIGIWGVIYGGCVCLSYPLHASSLEWRDYYRQKQVEAQPVEVPTPAVPQVFGHLLPAQPATRPSVVTAQSLQRETWENAKAEVPVLALPESGTLILLGLGLAGIASLIRKKKE